MTGDLLVRELSDAYVLLLQASTALNNRMQTAAVAC